MGKDQKSLPTAIRMEHISKSFGPVTALKEVSFTVRKGTVHALCGENGAGKSTLMKVLSGVYKPDSGKIFIDGTERKFQTPGDALDAGISMLYQELDLAGELTVAENMFLGREIMSKKIPFMMDSKAMRAKAAELIEKHHFDIDPDAKVKDLSMGKAQIVELLKATLRQASIIVMDEPTSSLSEKEAEILFRIIRDLKLQGLSIIYISHRMEEILDLADDVSILRDGAIVHTSPVKDIDIDTIVKHMVGREIKDYYPPKKTNPGKVRFEAKNLSSPEGIYDITFQVKAGEIAGMAGLVGAGRSETARAICGIVPKLTGEIFLDGKKLNIKRPADAIRAGIGYLTEDRKRTGLCVGLPCSWNMTLPNLEKINMRFFLNLAKERAIASEYGAMSRIKWNQPDDPADSLSGGNQQKILIARWLMADSAFLIVDEPTRGIDVGAKREVYELLQNLAAAGKAILVISSDLPELFGITDRINVMCHGRLAATLDTDKTTPEEVMHLAAIEKPTIQ